MMVPEKNFTHLLANRIIKLVRKYGPFIYDSDWRKVHTYVDSFLDECAKWYLTLDEEELENFVLEDWDLIVNSPQHEVYAYKYIVRHRAIERYESRPYQPWTIEGYLKTTGYE